MAGTLTGVLVAYSLDEVLLGWILDSTGYPPRFLMGILFGGVGYLTAATLSEEFEKWLERWLPLISAVEVVWGTSGLVLGLVVANLFCIPLVLVLNSNPVQFQIRSNPLLSSLTLLLPLFVNILLGSVGVYMFTRRQGELRGILFAGADRRGFATSKVLDTSAVIDGRVVELIRCKILEGPVVVPQFVLHELQFVADSSDAVRRERGRRGFHNLERLKELRPRGLEFPPVDIGPQEQVDAKLVAYCRETASMLITVDYNLNKLAQLQEVSSINVADAANALKPQVTMGDQVRIEIRKTGKEPGQGIGYLADGSMVVVESGGDLLGQTAAVRVEKILQTSAGRMVFANLIQEPRDDTVRTGLQVVNGGNPSSTG